MPVAADLRVYISKIIYSKKDCLDLRHEENASRMHVTQNYWVSGLYPSSRILDTVKPQSLFSSEVLKMNDGYGKVIDVRAIA
jgi:hypothetical protein